MVHWVKVLAVQVQLPDFNGYSSKELDSTAAFITQALLPGAGRQRQENGQEAAHGAI